MKTIDYLGDNPDNECTNQDIAIALLDNKTIKGYGRRQHGLNGKDADLDNAGQCAVDQIAIIDPNGADTMFIRIYLNRYASICQPTDDDEYREAAMQKIAEEIILMTDEYSGEWTGSDYWSFSMNEVIDVPLTVDEFDNPNLELLAERCTDWVHNSEEGKNFEEFATNLNKSIDQLYDMCDTDLGL
jgi:hypothetical protein